MTGACGFVGRNLVADLLEDTEELWIVDDLSTGLHPDRWLPALLGGAEGTGEHPRVYANGGRRVVFVEANLVALLVGELGLDGSAGSGLDWPVFTEAHHLASIVGGRQKIEGEPLQVGLDLAIDSMFFLWVWRERRVQRVLYASSSAAYPVNLQEEHGAVALHESAIDFPNNAIAMPDLTYGWSKLTGEYLAWLLATRHEIPAVSIRPFSGYGEDQDLTYPIPAIAGRAAARENPLVVWGTGHQARDFVHISDCIQAMRLALAKVEDGSGLNIGSGKLTSFLEVAGAFARLAGYEPEIKGTQSGPVGVHARYADPAATEQRLGWRPTISIDEGFGRVLAAQEKRLAVGADAP